MGKVKSLHVKNGNGERIGGLILNEAESLLLDRMMKAEDRVVLLSRAGDSIVFILSIYRGIIKNIAEQNDAVIPPGEFVITAAGSDYKAVATEETEDTVNRKYRMLIEQRFPDLLKDIPVKAIPGVVSLAWDKKTKTGGIYGVNAEFIHDILQSQGKSGGYADVYLGDMLLIRSHAGHRSNYGSTMFLMPMLVAMNRVDKISNTLSLSELL